MVIHQHVPMFHTEHCVFCAAFVPTGNGPTRLRPPLRPPCGAASRPRARSIRLRADAVCRNTLYSAVPQIVTKLVPLLDRGVGDFRVELLRCQEDRRQVGLIVTVYQDLLAERLSSHEADNAADIARRRQGQQATGSGG